MPDLSVYDGVIVTEDVRDSGLHATAVLVLPSLVSAGSTNISVTADIILPVLIVDGLTGAVAAVEFPRLFVHGHSISGTICNAAITLPELEIVSQSSSPGIAIANIILPSLIVTGTSIHSVIAFANIILPALNANGVASLTPRIISYALNLRSLGLSEYANYNFNSLCVINGKSFGASSTGLYLLEGTTDAGEHIDAHVTFPLTDFGIDNEKRVRSVYFGGSFGRTMYLHVWTNEGIERVRLFRSSIQRKRKAVVLVGRGAEGEYWQFKVSNHRGSMFELDTLETFLIVRRRGN